MGDMDEMHFTREVERLTEELAAANKRIRDIQTEYNVLHERNKYLERKFASANKRAGEAREVAIEDVCALQSSASREMWHSLFDEQKAIRALATVPSGHVVVPVEFMDAMHQLRQDYYDYSEGKTNMPFQTLRLVITQALEEYDKAARPK